MTCIGHENTMHMILENFILFLKMQSTCTCYCLHVPQIWAMMMMIIITTYNNDNNNNNNNNR